MILDLEKNFASGIYFPTGTTPALEQTSLDYPSGSIFNSQSKLHICPNGECTVHTLDMIYDAYGGDYDPLDLLYGIHRSFIFLSFYKNN